MTIRPNLTPRNPLALLPVAALVGALALTACGKKEEPTAAPAAPSPAPAAPATPPPAADAPPAAAPVTVTSIDLGTAVDDAQKVTGPKTEFAPTDTIYASVATSGTAPTAVVSAKFTFEDGQTVNESSQTIAPTGATSTSFHISKPDGWPVGKYKVEVAIDGKPASSKDFSVK